jgi:Flp pilus assembly protein TadG
MILGDRIDAKALQPLVSRLSHQVIGDERGASLVEMAFSATIVIGMLIGITQVSIALYANDFMSQAAREGARWAIVRGGSSCTNTPTLDHCNASPSDIQTYVRGLGYPFASSVSVSTTWLAEQITLDSNAVPSTTWVTSCTAGTSVVCPNGSSGTNAAGNQVKVTVSYNYPLNIPFWSNATIQMGSTSAMVISQ